MVGRRPTPVELIEKKRDGGRLTELDIETFIHAVLGTCSEEVKPMDDVQVGAMLMAILMRGLDSDEATYLTKYMKYSGDVLQWGPDDRVVDKHSIGGVGDKVSLPLAPILAACGVMVPMLSGRGLGHTGGTLDKLDSIPGYSAYMSTEEMQQATREVGCVIVGTTEKITPADKKLYGFRDITGTVWCKGLIYGSILSKKAAEGIKDLVLDLKCGKGCYLDTMEKVEEASKGFMAIATGLGIKLTCMVTRMDTPIGFCVGNALEVQESVEFLKNADPKPLDLQELILTQGGVLLKSCGKCDSVEDGKALMLSKIHNGEALEKFRQMIMKCGVAETTANKLCSRDEDCYTSVLPQAKHKFPITAKSSAIITAIDALSVALACNHLGAGRKTAEDTLKFGVGLHLQKHLGDKVNSGDILAYVHSDTPLEGAKNEVEQIETAFTVSDVPSFTVPPMVIKY